MQVVPHTGIVKEVIDAINLAVGEGPLCPIHTIVLTREEMDEFIARNPFKGGVGKYYGDGDVPSLMNVENSTDGQSVLVFYLSGVRVEALPPVLTQVPEPEPAE